MPLNSTSFPLTAPLLDAAALSVSATVLNLYRELRSAESFQPSPALALLFQRLVRTSTARHSGHTVAASLAFLTDILPHFRHLQSLAEYALEEHWADRVAASAAPWESLAGFPYFPGYEALIAAEQADLQKAVGKPIKSVLFAGSGPLCLSAILLASRYGIDCTCVDINPKAVSQSRNVIAALGLENKIRVIHSDIADLSALNCSAVCVAALAGETATEKTVLLNRLHDAMPAGSHLLIRSVEGLGALHYYPLQPGELGSFSYLATVRPPQPAVNTALIARR